MDQFRRVLTVLIFITLVPALALAQTVLTGQTDSGAFYQIAVPPDWQPANGLVIWNHGFDLGQPEAEPDLGPLAALQLSEGYAVAASSYSLNGWALFNTLEDNQQLYEVFTDEVGVPDHVLLNGASLGGIVTAQAIEGGGVGNVVGAMPICGALGGSRIWNGAFDLRLLYDFVCKDVPGAQIPGGATGLPVPPDPSFDNTALAVAVNACTGILAPPDLRTPEQAANLDRLLSLGDLPENFLLTDMGFATFGMADLTQDPRKLGGGGQALGNANVDYGDAEVNAGVERVVSDLDALAGFLDYFTPKGDVGDTKIVSIHTDKDGLVLLENESEYASVVPAENFVLGVVVEDEPSHCGFTQAETVAAWETLRGWVAGAPQPNAAVIQGTCDALVAGGLAEGPCRIDPGFVVPDINERVRPRTPCNEDSEALCLGDRFLAEVEWRDFDGNSGPAQVTPLRTADTGSFYFFSPNNVELMAKVLDGRRENGNFWVFYGSLTNVGFDLTVTDTETGLVRTYTNGSGEFASVGDTNSF